MMAGEVQAEFTAMGCPCKVRLWTADRSLAQDILHASLQEAVRFEHKYSRYRQDSIISLINQAAGQRAVAIDAETAGIMEYSDACFVQSDGYFDITAGKLREIWPINAMSLPTQSDINSCLETVGWDKVKLEKDTIFLTRQGMELDLGGVVKEYAADAIAEQARQAGIDSGYVNLGGDIAIIGPQPDGKPWPIGISHPQQPEEPIATIQLSKGALTTSGGYERYVRIEGKKYSHLINPKTGWPVEGLASVSVATSKAVIAGSLSSIALLKGEVEGISFLKTCNVPFFAIDQLGNHHSSRTKLVDTYVKTS